MNFNSLEYAIFLPIAFIVHWSIKNKYRWIILLLCSYYFYMCWNAKYVVLIAFTTIVSYTAARIIEKQQNVCYKKIVLFFSLIVSLGVLFFFKYFNFMFETLSFIADRFCITMHPVTVKVLLPVGISFYTFQTLSYVIDVYCY